MQMLWPRKFSPNARPRIAPLAGLALACALACAWGVALAGTSACTHMVVSADPAYPPLHWYDGGTFRGASIEIARRVLDDLKIPYEFRYVGPFARLMIAAENGEVDMIATLKSTPEREKFLLFAGAGTLSNPVAAFVARLRPVNYNGREDLVGLRGGITRGNRFGDGFDEFLQSRLTVEEANTPEANFRKLATGRIDYFVTGYYTGMAHLIKFHQEDQFLALKPYVADTANFLALTRKGHCADQLQAIEARLSVLKKNGTLDRLVRESLQTWKSYPTVHE